MRRIAIALALILSSLMVFSLQARQTTHPCDQVIPSPQQLPSSQSTFQVGFCRPTVEAVTSAHVKVDGADAFTGTVTASGSPTADGRQFYVVNKAFTMPAVGAHNIIISAINATGEGAPTAAIPFAVVLAAPGVPSVGRVF